MKALVLVLVLVLAVRKWVCMPALVVGQSMSPTLKPGELVLVNKLAYLFHKPERGDIVCIWTGRGYMIKRVIGLPGEDVSLAAGRLHINGKMTPEAYLHDSYQSEIAPGLIPPNRLGVIGDNREESIAALVNQRRIVGKLVNAGSHQNSTAPPS